MIIIKILNFRKDRDVLSKRKIINKYQGHFHTLCIFKTK